MITVITLFYYTQQKADNLYLIIECLLSVFVCVAVTFSNYILSFLPLFMVTLLILYTEYFKCLGCFTFTSNNRCDADLYKQVRMLYCRSNCLVDLYIFNKCSEAVLLKPCRSFWRYSLPLFLHLKKKYPFWDLICI